MGRGALKNVVNLTKVMEIIFRPEAEAELFEAQAWYESRSQGLGIEFAQAVTVAVESVLRMPFAYPRQFAT